MYFPTEVRGLWGGAVALSWGPGRQAVSWRARKTLTGGQRAVQRGQTAAGLQQIGLFCDLTEQRVALLTASETVRKDRGREVGLKLD